MKITQLLQEDKVTLSLEVFPPKKDTAVEQVSRSVREIAALQPDFMSVTYGAGGGTSAYTVQIAKDIKAEYNVPSMAHLTCVSSTKETVKKQLECMQEAGIENVLALRGDIPADAEFPLPDQFHYAVELVRYIKQIAPEMCIGGACYISFQYLQLSFSNKSHIFCLSSIGFSSFFLLIKFNLICLVKKYSLMAYYIKQLTLYLGLLLVQTFLFPNLLLYSLKRAFPLLHFLVSFQH